MIAEVSNRYLGLIHDWTVSRVMRQQTSFDITDVTNQGLAAPPPLPRRSRLPNGPPHTPRLDHHPVPKRTEHRSPPRPGRTGPPGQARSRFGVQVAPNRRRLASASGGRRRPGTGSCTCRAGTRPGPRHRREAASYHRPRPARLRRTIPNRRSPAVVAAGGLATGTPALGPRPACCECWSTSRTEISVPVEVTTVGPRARTIRCTCVARWWELPVVSRCIGQRSTLRGTGGNWADGRCSAGNDVILARDPGG
jgi:hypothetical protein